MSGPTQTLLIESEDARVHCAVLNVRPDTAHTPPPDPRPPEGDTAVRETGRPCGDNGCPLPQDPTARLRPTTRPHPVPHAPKGAPY